MTREEDNYRIPATFVHRAILAILGALFGLVGYMVIWASNDAAVKENIAVRLKNVEDKVAKGQLSEADKRLTVLEKESHNHSEN